jgi:5-formyltetrahydrofolate cyclo-ligase
MLKQDLRKELLEKRKNLSLEEIEVFSQKIHDLLFSRIMIHRFSPIHIFLPILKNKEVNTIKIIETLRKDFSPDIYISRVLENQELEHVAFKPSTKLKINKWEIPEPDENESGLSSEGFFEQYKEQDILVIIPLLGFDKTGQRIGYGKGFYDNFLRFKSDKTLCIGVSIFEALDEPITDISTNDIKLNHCITPTKIWTWER